jgi:surface protein
MGISDRKRNIEVPVSINLDLTQETKPNQFLVDNNFKSGDFVSRKKSGNILAGSKLNVEGQGIYNVKIIKKGLTKFFPKPTSISEGNPPTPTPSITPSTTPLTCDFTYVVSSITNTPTPTPTYTPTPTNVGCLGIPYNLYDIFDAPLSGNILFGNENLQQPTNNPDEIVAGGILYFNVIDYYGVDRTSYFSNLVGNYFTLTLCQNNVSAIFSGNPLTITYLDLGSPFGFNYYWNVSEVGNNLVEIVSANTIFNYNELVYVDYTFSLPPTPTPTPTNTTTPTYTPTNTITPTYTPTQTHTSTNTPTPTYTPTQTQTPSTTPPPGFVSVWRTTSTNESITLPYNVSGNYSGTIFWGDGSYSANTFANRTHTYAVPGDYTVTIYGLVKSMSFNGTGDMLKIREILQWGPNFYIENIGTFNGCSNLVLTGVTDTPIIASPGGELTFYGCSSITSINNINSWNMSSVNNINSMFRGCTNWDDNIGNWDVSNINIFSYTFRATKFDNGGSDSIGNWIFKNGAVLSSMFYESQYFNRNIGSWNLSNVNGSIDSLFYGATIFNNGNSPSISGWTMSGITSLRNLFSFTQFNQNINSWNTSNVTNMDSTFWFSSSFNQPLSGWNTNKVTTMYQTFSNASLFNQPIGSWNVSGVTLMNSMFAGATNFNQNLGNWNVSKVTNFTSMFSNAIVFNNGGSPSISGWTINTTSGVTMAAMFATAGQFNQPIGSWDVSRVTTMSQMFYQATLFNQPLSGWNVSNVTLMFQMFQSTPFNQDIGNWNISGVTSFADFMAGKTPLTLSTTNLDSIYNGWSTKTPQTGLTINFGSAKHTSLSSAGKAILTGSTGSGGYEWTITDGGI